MNKTETGHLPRRCPASAEIPYKIRLFEHAQLCQDHSAECHEDQSDRNGHKHGHAAESHNIHAIEAKDNIGDRHDDGDSSQDLHNDIEVIGDDGGKGIHGTGQNARVDITHLNGLLDLDEHIFQQILVVLIELDDPAPENLFQGQLIGFERGGEVYKALFQAQQLEQLLVLHRSVS